MIHPGVLERIAAALETIADALTGQNPAPAAARSRARRSDAQFEWEPDNDQIPTAPLPEPAPPEERCGFLIEQFTHPLDRTTPIYQISKDGVTYIADAQDAAALAAMSDELFTVAAGARLDAVAAQRAGLPGAAEPEDDDERRQREWARTIARADT